MSQVVWFPVVVLQAAWHVLLRYGLGRPDWEPTVAAATVGGFFGLAVVPPLVVAALLYGVDHGTTWYTLFCRHVQGRTCDDYQNEASSFSFWSSSSSSCSIQTDFGWYVGLPLVVLYVVQVLILDDSPRNVELAAPIPPRSTLERWANALTLSYTQYFPITVVPWSPTAALPPSNQYVFAVHPHGIHCLALAQFSTYGSDFDQLFPGLVGHALTGLAATILFTLPVVRELFLTMGYVDARRSVASQVLATGRRSIFVCTGGEQESLTTTVGRDIVVLQGRKGFVRLALSHGAQLVPVFAAGLTDIFPTYTQRWPWYQRASQWLQKTCGIAVPLFHGRWFVTPLPYAKPIQVLIGKPIVTPQPAVRGQRPDEELVEEYHAKYIKALQALHQTHVPDRVLEIR